MIILDDGVRVGQQKALDSKYDNDGEGYANVPEANSLIIPAERSLGLKVFIQGQIYWYRDGIADSDLILYQSAGGTVTSVAATGNNGITVIGSPITTGGTLIFGLDNITPTSIGSATTVTTQSANDNSTKIASTEYVDRSVTNYEEIKNFQYPADYTFRPFSIAKRGRKYTTSLKIRDLVDDKISRLKPYFVDFTTGVNSTSNGSETSPYKTILYALQQGAKLIYLLNNGVHQTSTFSGINNGTYGADDKFIIAKYPGETYIVNNYENPIWNASGSIYSATTVGVVGGILDMKYTNTEGLPFTLVAKSNTTDVQTTPGSYYADSTNNIVYVNTIDGRLPDSTVFVLLNNISKTFSSFANEYLYMEGITFMGGSNAFNFSTQTNPGTGNALINNCKFLYSRDNGLRITNTGGVVWSNECDFYDNGRDGANYTQNTLVTSQKVIETFCRGWHNGYRRGTLTEYAMNGSSVHDNITVMRIGGTYWDNFGPNINDVNGSSSLIVGVQCTDSRGANSSGQFIIENGDFSTSSNNTNPPSKMWVYDSISRDSTRSLSTPLYMNNSSLYPQTAMLYLDRSSYIAPTLNNVVFGSFVVGNAPDFVFPALSSFTPYNFVNSVTGTSNQIVITGNSTDPIIGIDSAYTTARNTYADAKVQNSNASSTTIAPSSTAVNTLVATKQDTLVSGTNIKTINGNSVLGSGNITITGGSGTVTNVSGNSGEITVTNPTTTPVISIDPAYTLPKIDLATGSPVTVKKVWYGTKSQYDALDTYPTDTEFNIETSPTILSGSATLDFGNTASASSTDLTITVTGAADGDAVSLGVPSASVLANTCYTARVSAADTVSVRFNNYSALSANPASGLFKVKILK